MKRIKHTLLSFCYYYILSCMDGVTREAAEAAVQRSASACDCATTDTNACMHGVLGLRVSAAE